jgi:hypothetical protein
LTESRVAIFPPAREAKKPIKRYKSSVSKNPEIPQNVEKWADRIRTVSSTSDPQAARKLAGDIYRAAQEDLDAERARAEYEREE